jgi:hypothetical protein
MAGVFVSHSTHDRDFIEYEIIEPLARHGMEFWYARTSIEAYEEAVQLSMQRYTEGKAAYFEVLEAQQQLFPAENTLAQTELN